MKSFLQQFRNVSLVCFLPFLIAGHANAQEVPSHKLPRPVVSEEHNIEQKFINVFGHKMAYLELGKGETVIYIHGNPTSSYLWRNIMPYMEKTHKNIALDLIGMGGSDKPDLKYSFKDHYRYLEQFIDKLGGGKVTLVGHDWGAALAWEYARHHPKKVKALAFMEGILPPMFPKKSFEAMGKNLEGAFRAFKDPVKGPEMVIEKNMFIEQMLPSMVNRKMGEKAMTVYRAPFLKKESRKPILAWPNAVPIAGTPKENKKALNNISKFMGKTKMPTLLLYASPGVIVTKDSVRWYSDKIKNLETSYIGQGLHFIQEDQPDAIGLALADWLRRTP